MWQARASCLRLLLHLRRAAASRTFCTAGTSRPMRMAMMAITTSSSISVKPRRRVPERDRGDPKDNIEKSSLSGLGEAKGNRTLHPRAHFDAQLRLRVIARGHQLPAAGVGFRDAHAIDTQVAARLRGALHLHSGLALLVGSPARGLAAVAHK